MQSLSFIYLHFSTTPHCQILNRVSFLNFEFKTVNFQNAPQFIITRTEDDCPDN